MGTSEKFCLRWNDFENNISGAFRELREDKDFFDVTLACDDDQMQAHKVILSACSPFFRTILRRNKHEHPLLYLKGVKFTDLVSVLNFMYHGEVNVAQEELNSFLAVAEDLKVKGLTQNNSPSKQQNTAKPRVREQVERVEQPQQPKRPRPAPPPVSRPPPPDSYHSQDDDIQEVVPIKMEPVPIPQEAHHTTSHAVMAPVQQTYSAPQQQVQVEELPTAGVVADPNMEYGDDYGDYGGYDGADGGYDESVLDNSGLAPGGQDGNKDVSVFMASLIDETGEEKWQCLVCNKICKRKYILRDHVESHHFTNQGHDCQLCGNKYKTKNSLQKHVSTYHKENKTVNLGIHSVI